MCEIFNNKANIHHYQGDLNEAIDCLQSALELAKPDLFKGTTERVSTILFNLADTHLCLREFPEALRLIEEILENNKQINEENSKIFASTMVITLKAFFQMQILGMKADSIHYPILEILKRFDSNVSLKEVSSVYGGSRLLQYQRLIIAWNYSQQMFMCLLKQLPLFALLSSPLLRESEICGTNYNKG